MLIFDLRIIGNNLLRNRKNKMLTQSEVAEIAGLSDRTYADIERGNVNMKTETLLQICKALDITPDDILTETEEIILKKQESVFERLDNVSDKEKETAIKLLSIYLDSLEM